MAKPTFICIGVQKSGTTSLINYLSSHPDIYIRKKEGHFFDTTPNLKLTAKQIRAYESKFETTKSIIGEKTPSYSYLPFAINNIHSYNPNIKLILILREPISRAYSAYAMEVRRNRIQASVTKAWQESFMREELLKEKDIDLTSLTRKGKHFIIRGFYDQIIEHILSKFPRENLYITISEEVKTNKLIEYNKIYKFLGATEITTLDENQDARNGTYVRQMPTTLAKEMYKIYQPHNERLYQILGRKIEAWERYYHQF